MAAPGPLGRINPEDMDQTQRDAFEAAKAMLPRFAAPPVDLPKGTMVSLTNFLRDPKVIADIGAEFTGFGQYTGSCVGVSEGNAIITELAVQRCIKPDFATKVEIPWWPHPYGRSRWNSGMRGQGEGSIDSVMGTTLVEEGWYAASAAGLPGFNKAGPDGWWLTEQLEYQWSDGGKIATHWKDLAVARKGMVKTVLQDIMGVRYSIVNGYPVLNGCNNYVGSGSVASGGGTPYVRGRYDGRGGHSTNYIAVWHHPNDGYLYGYWNQWDTRTYPKDPAGLVRCAVWVPEENADNLFQTGGDDGETMALSQVPGLPAQPEVLNWIP